MDDVPGIILFSQQISNLEEFVKLRDVVAEKLKKTSKLTLMLLEATDDNNDEEHEIDTHEFLQVSCDVEEDDDELFGFVENDPIEDNDEGFEHIDEFNNELDIQTTSELLNSQPNNTTTTNNIKQKVEEVLAKYQRVQPKQTSRHRCPYFESENCQYTALRARDIQSHVGRQHLNLNEKQKHQCSYCYKFYTEDRSLKEHIKAVHLKIKPHKCNVCGVSFAKKYNLKDHLTRHSSAKNCVCEYCNKAFKRDSTLRAHKRACPLNPLLAA